ncbi:MAG TPA: DUF1631 family protein, partial [Variovorax sp.]
MTTRSHATSLRLSREVRERFVVATEAAIAPIGLAIQERLAVLAGQTGNSREMQDNRDGYLAVQAQGANWVTASQSAWRKALASSMSEEPSANSLSRLELLGDEVVETGILSSRLAQAVQDKASFELNDLRLRIQHLDGTTELGAKDILKPEALAKVLVDQWLATGLDRPLWAKIQDQVQLRLVETMVKAYKDANAFLVARDVMPEIDLKSFVRRTGASNSGSAALGNQGGGGGGGAPSIPQGQVQMAPGGFGVPAGSFAPAAIGISRGQGSGMAGGDTLVATGGSPLLLARQRAQGVLLNLKRFVTARIGGDLGQMRMAGASGLAGGGGGGGV